MNRILRGIAAAIGIVLIIAFALCSAWGTEVRELNMGEDEIALVPGDAAEVPLDVPFRRIERASVRLSDVSAGQEMTVTLSLMQGGAAVASEAFPIAGKRSLSPLQLSPETPVTGSASLRVEAQGEGRVTLTGENGALYVRLTGGSVKRNLSMLYLGVTMLLLAAVPAGGKEASHA